MGWIGRVLRALFLIILLLVCAALFFILVIMGDPGEKEQATTASVAAMQPLPGMPQPSLYFDAGNLYQAEYYFNDPILRLSSASGYQLDGVTVQETKPKGADATVREIRLQYISLGSGRVIYVSSLSPARYLRSLPERGFVTAPDQDWALAGMAAVLMRGGSAVHLHALQGETVYQLEGDIGEDELRQCAAAAEL